MDYKELLLAFIATEGMAYEHYQNIGTAAPTFCPRVFQSQDLCESLACKQCWEKAIQKCQEVRNELDSKTLVLA